MIVSFIHRGLEKLFTENKTKGVKQDHVKRLKIRLTILNEIESLEDLNEFPNFRLYKLSGEFKSHYSIWVTGNWRLIFEWDEINKNVNVLDYPDYH